MRSGENSWRNQIIAAASKAKRKMAKRYQRRNWRNGGVSAKRRSDGLSGVTARNKHGVSENNDIGSAA